MDGHSLKSRLEDRRLLTGGGIFASDRNLPGQLHVAFLRSDRAHAEIVAIDAGAALAMPGVHCVLTGSYMDYPMPRAGLLRGVTLLDHPMPTATNPLGAKGVGESGVTGGRC